MSRASVPFSEAVDQRRCYRGDVSLLESSRSASFQYSPASWTWSCRRRRRRIIAGRRSPRLAAAAPLGELVAARRAIYQGGCSWGRLQAQRRQPPAVRLSSPPARPGEAWIW